MSQTPAEIYGFVQDHLFGHPVGGGDGGHTNFNNIIGVFELCSSLSLHVVVEVSGILGPFNVLRLFEDG